MLFLQKFGFIPLTSRQYVLAYPDKILSFVIQDLELFEKVFFYISPLRLITET